MQDWIINFDFSFNLIKSLINKKGTDHLLAVLRQRSAPATSSSPAGEAS